MAKGSKNNWLGKLKKAFGPHSNDNKHHDSAQPQQQQQQPVWTAAGGINRVQQKQQQKPGPLHSSLNERGEDDCSTGARQSYSDQSQQQLQRYV